MMRGVRRSAGLAAGVVAVAFVIAAGAELLLRYAKPWHDPDQQLRFIAGPDRFPTLGPADRSVWNVSIADGWRTSVQFDRFGLRQAGDIVHADPNAVFVVGDYFPFGWGVEAGERFTELLATMLRVEVHNIAILGNLPQGDLKLIHYAESLGAPVRRLLIVLPMESVVQSYSGSPRLALPENEADFPSPSRLAAAHLSPERYRAIAGMWRVPYDSLPGVGGEASSPSIEIRQWLLSHSALYRAALLAAHSNPRIQAAAARLGLSESRRPVQVGAEDGEAIRITVDLLARIAGHYELMLAVVPSPAVWIGDHRDKERRRHADFVSALAEQGLAYCDLLPAFDDAGGIDALAYPRELHWNATAHKITVDALAPVASAYWHIASR
jgi:hypothetical protein